jgi:hypothetical protein
MEPFQFMTFRIEKIPNLPVVLLTLFREYNLADDFPNSYAEAVTLLDSMDGPVFYLNDLTEAALDLEDIIRGSALLCRDKHGTYHHPNVREVLLISTSLVIHEAARGLTSRTFGHVPVRVFYTLYEALDYVRASR